MQTREQLESITGPSIFLIGSKELCLSRRVTSVSDSLQRMVKSTSAFSFFLVACLGVSIPHTEHPTSSIIDGSVFVQNEAAVSSKKVSVLPFGGKGWESG